MKNQLITTALVLASFISLAQQEIMYSQYMFNGQVINPAVSGVKGHASLTFLHRKQWLNFEGAPITQSFTLNGPVLGKNVGLGLMVENDKVGVTNRLNIFGSYAYHLNFGFGKKLSAGIQGGVSNYSSVFSDPSRFRVWNAEDPVFASDRKVTLPNFGFGLYYHHSDRFYSGISIPRLLDYRKGPIYSENLKDIPKEQRHYYLTSGYTLKAGNNFKITPSFLVKYVQAAPIQGDFNLSLLFSETLTIGGSYRTGDAIAGMIGLQLNNRLRFGYAYDMTVSNLKNYSSDTHEILVGYDFFKEVIKMKTPRFF